MTKLLPNPRSLLLAALAVPLVLLLPGSHAGATGSAPARSLTQSVLRYDIRLRGAKIGTARIDVGRARTRRGRRVRRVRLRADIRPLGTRALGVGGDGTSWVTARHYRPVAARWNWQEVSRPTRVEATWSRRGNLDGRYFANGEQRKRIQRQHPGHFSDLLSVVPWLMATSMSPGAEIKTTTFTGNQVYEVTGKVGSPTTIHLPAGSRNAYPLAMTAVRPGKTRQFTIWVDVATGTPCRLEFEHDIVGSIDAVLSYERRR